MSHFALIDARTNPENCTKFDRFGQEPQPIAPVKIHVPPDADRGIGISILIGSNGTGKTRLITSIADAFIQLDDARQNDRTVPIRKFALSELRYSIGNNTYHFSSYGPKNLQIEKNGRRCDLADIELPKRVVTLTVAPHDRFPLGKVYSKSRELDEGIYRYMGLRDRTGRASMITFLYSALENLLENNEHLDGRRDRIVSVFNLLKYKPRFDITYSLRMSQSNLLEALKSDQFIENLPSYQQRRVIEMIAASPQGYAGFRSSLINVLDRISERKHVTISADISAHDHGEILQFQKLRRAGILSIRAIEIERHDGIFVNLKEASSGELSIAASFLALAGVLEDQSLVLIDEPEISLHPEWQSKYVETLTSTFKGYYGCQYIIATHSPLIVSDVPEFSSIYSLDKNTDVDGEAFSGGSADRLLAQLFQAPSTSNLYIKEEIISALRLATDGDADKPEFKLAVSNLVKIGVNIGDEEPVKKVINALELTLRGSQ